MLLTLQFPIADLRALLPDRAGRRELPDWPPKAEPPSTQFVRFFGGAERRARGSDDAWTDEKSFCRADQALRFVGLGASKFLTHRTILPACSFRRLMSDGRVVARVEVGISLPHRREKMSLGLNTEEFLQIANATLHLPTLVRTHDGELVRHPLVLQGKDLSRLLAYATSYRRKYDFKNTARLVEAGTPLLFIDLGDDEIDALPPSFIKIEASNALGSELAFGRIEASGVTVPVWVLGPGQAKTAQLRSLRLCLLRLHAEREALNTVLNGLDRGWIIFEPGTAQGDVLEQYLNDATHVIYRESWSNINQSAILEALDSAEKVEYPADQSRLLSRYDGARKQVWRKVERYDAEIRAVRNIKSINVERGGNYVEKGQIIHGGNFYGTVIGAVDAERIENSFNTFNTSNPSDDLKTAVAALHDQVKDLIAKLPADSPQKDEVLGNLEAFTDQASKKKPLSEVLKVTGKGLVEAAKTVAEMVGPISTAVVGVLKLFGLILG